MTSFRRRFSNVCQTSFKAPAAVGLVFVAAMALPAVSAAAEPYDLKTFSNRTIDAAEAPYAVAGGHPDKNITEFSLEVVEDLNGAYVNPPLGFIGNPAAALRCPSGLLPQPGAVDTCPSGSQVGLVDARLSLAVCSGCSMYNMRPEYGYPAQFGFRLFNTTTLLSAFLLPRTESYGLAIGTPTIPALELSQFQSTFFGVPSQHGSGTSGAPFLSNPVDCSVTDPAWRIAVDSSQNPGVLRALGVPDLSDPNWKTASEPASPVTGCEDPALTDQFAQAGLGVRPLQGGGATQADSPTGLAVDLDFPQSNDPTDLSTTFDASIPQAPEPKDITVTLPAGLSINPSSADGLGACSDLASNPAGDQVHYDNTNPVSCPDASKIGSVTALSPLLALRDPIDDHVIGPEPIPGAVYLLKPHPGDLPVGGGNQAGKFRLLIELENPRYGINVKIPGVATADPNTGQLTTTFTQNPQLPASRITVSLKDGPRAPLASPVTCGKFASASTLVPWSTPGTPDAHPSASFDVGSGPNGAVCPASAAARPFAPTISAGTDSSAAGHSSPFTLRIDRADGHKELGTLDLTLPEGLSAKLAGIPACSEAALAAAATRTGAAEQADPTCPASRIGSVKVGAGAGSNPFFASGEAYLAGPYKGAPMSVAVITPAVAGPFDLGAIVVKNALYLNPATAQAHVVSDPLPQMLDGIPLRLRTIIVNLDRPDFTLNPTDCTATAINATLTSVDGTSSSPTQAFQAGDCDKLGFKPNLKLALKGKVSRRSHPSLRATLVARPGDANIAKAQVKLPKAAFLDNAHIGQVCTRVQFAADQCPEASIYGTASATTPLLDYPLSGNVYLRSSSNKLPDLVVGFNGPSSQPIEVELSGKTDSVKGALRNTFEAVPDVPVSKFSLTLFGGKKGLIIMSSGFCANPRADIKFTGQNGMESNTTPKVKAKCPKKKGKKKASKRSHQR